MRITFKAFDSKLASREKLFKAALEFANKLKREDLINITHTEDRDNIIVTIWYWTEDTVDRREAIRAKLPLTGNAATAIVTGGDVDAAPTALEQTPGKSPVRTDSPAVGITLPDPPSGPKDI